MLTLGVVLAYVVMEVLDWALAQRAMPAMRAARDLPALRVLPSLLTGLPRCLTVFGVFRKDEILFRF